MKQATHSKKIPRNAPCPCGSGRKYKHCCAKATRRDNGDFLGLPFKRLPRSKQIYYLDTCAWSDVLESEATHDGFVSFFQSSDRVAGASIYCLFELSERTREKIAEHDSLFFNMRQHIYIPCWGDQFIKGELESFPSIWEMRWLPLHVLIDERRSDLLQQLFSRPDVVTQRDGHRQFGLDYYMELEEFKENFPPLYGDEHTIDDANPYSWGVTFEWLERHFPEFLGSKRKFIRKGRFDSFDSLLSVRIRNLFVFFKYYLHGQSPRISDFLDFAQVSYAPYCDAFVTERNTWNVLRRIKKNGLMLPNTRILHLSDFLAEISTSEPHL